MGYRFEPHDHILLAGHRVQLLYDTRTSTRGVPGVGQLGGYWEGCIPGT